MALRVLAPNAIRPIEDLRNRAALPRGEGVVRDDSADVWSRPKVERHRFNAQVSRRRSRLGRSYEMFSQGEPVLARAWTFDSARYLFAVCSSEPRRAMARHWARPCFGAASGASVLEAVETVVHQRHAARGIAAGVSEVFPQAEQLRRYAFMCSYEMPPKAFVGALERRAYGAI